MAPESVSRTHEYKTRKTSQNPNWQARQFTNAARNALDDLESSIKLLYCSKICGGSQFDCFVYSQHKQENFGWLL